MVDFASKAALPLSDHLSGQNGEPALRKAHYQLRCNLSLRLNMPIHVVGATIYFTAFSRQDRPASWISKCSNWCFAARYRNATQEHWQDG